MPRTPLRGARDALAGWLRVVAPFTLRLPDEKKAEYARAAGAQDGKRANSLGVDGTRFRVTRVGRLVRIGPAGPEGPRPGDYAPEPPVEVHTRQLKERGPWTEEDEDEPPELDERTRGPQALREAEEKRRAAVKEREERQRRGGVRPPSPTAAAPPPSRPPPPGPSPR